MNAKNQLGASQLNPQIVPGPRLPENEVIVRREDEFAAHERFGITPHSTGISYDDLKILTDKILRDSHAL